MVGCTWEKSMGVLSFLFFPSPPFLGGGRALHLEAVVAVAMGGLRTSVRYDRWQGVAFARSDGWDLS